MANREDELAILKNNMEAMQDMNDLGHYAAKKMLIDRDHYLFLGAEIERLQEAKRAALKVADERSKEAVAVRQENERLRAANRQMLTALVWVRSWAGKVSESQRVAGEALDAVEQTGDGK